MDDGCTPEQRRVGRKWKRAAVTFVEKVYYRHVAPSGGSNNDREMRMVPAIFVRRHERTGTHILIIPSGVDRGLGLHPMPQDKKWDNEFLKSCALDFILFALQEAVRVSAGIGVGRETESKGEDKQASESGQESESILRNPTP